MTSMIARLALVALVAFAPGQEPSEKSQPPPPSSGKESQAPPQQPEPQSAQPGGSKQEGVGNVTVTIQAPPVPQSAQKPRDESDDEDDESASGWWTFLSALAAIMQAVFAGVLAVLTYWLIDVGRRQREVAAAQAETINGTLAATKIIERAYVSLSHTQPGLTFHPPDASKPASDIRVTIAAKNGGNTPGAVLAQGVAFIKGANLPPNPARPPVPRVLEPMFTVMPREAIYLWHNFPVPPDELEAIRAMMMPAYVVGWIIYKDSFGKTHRSGYARRYVTTPRPDANNLVFVDVPGYNYEEDLD